MQPKKQAFRHHVFYFTSMKYLELKDKQSLAVTLSEFS